MNVQPRGPSEGDTELRIRRGRVDSVDLFEIKESELDLLEKGSPAGLQLNFAIFLISLAFSASAAVATASFRNSRIETVFIIVIVVGFLLGAYLFIAWFRTRSAVKDVCADIRRRIPPDAIAGDAPGIPPAPAKPSDER